MQPESRCTTCSRRPRIALHCGFSSRVGSREADPITLVLAVFRAAREACSQLRSDSSASAERCPGIRARAGGGAGGRGVTAILEAGCRVGLCEREIPVPGIGVLKFRFCERRIPGPGFGIPGRPSGPTSVLPRCCESAAEIPVHDLRQAPAGSTALWVQLTSRKPSGGTNHAGAGGAWRGSVGALAASVRLLRERRALPRHSCRCPCW